jgi:hypothetical protein
MRICEILPFELEEYIVQYLQAKDLLSAMTVCKRFHAYCRRECIWMQLCHFLVTPLQLDLTLHSMIKYGEEGEKWKKMYKILSRSHFIRDQSQYDDLFDRISLRTLATLFFFPGEYKLNDHALPRCSIIGLGRTT